MNPDNFDEANAVIGSSASVSYIKYITDGEITGTKISDEEWQVTINVSMVLRRKNLVLLWKNRERALAKAPMKTFGCRSSKPMFSTKLFNSKFPGN